MKKLRISAISYINTLPFVYGLEHYSPNHFEMQLDHPSDCADKLISGEVDVGIVPLASLPHIPGGNIISDYCVACDGPVESVILFSDVPVNNIRKIYMDYQSRTSVQLVKILAEKFWNIQPEWIEGTPGYENKISGLTAGLVIGDRALKMRGTYRSQYDLGAEWKSYCGLPFVFACWVANRKIEKRMTIHFNAALKYGLDKLEDIISTHKDNHKINIEHYLKDVISFKIDQDKRKSMELFLNMIR